MQRGAAVCEQVPDYEVSAEDLHFGDRLPLNHNFYSNHCFGPDLHYLIQEASQSHHPPTNQGKLSKM